MNPLRNHVGIGRLHLAAQSLLLTVMMSGCVNPPRYSEFADVSPRGWLPGEEIVFSPLERDSTLRGHRTTLRWCVCHDENAPDNFRVVLEQESLETPARVDTVTLTTGRRNARGRHAPHLPQESEGTVDGVFRVPDGYLISVSPLDTVVGIHAIGFILQ